MYRLAGGCAHLGTPQSTKIGLFISSECFRFHHFTSLHLNSPKNEKIIMLVMFTAHLRKQNPLRLGYGAETVASCEVRCRRERANRINRYIEQSIPCSSNQHNTMSFFISPFKFRARARRCPTAHLFCVRAHCDSHFLHFITYFKHYLHVVLRTCLLSLGSVSRCLFAASHCKCRAPRNSLATQENLAGTVQPLCFCASFAPVHPIFLFDDDFIISFPW